MLEDDQLPQAAGSLRERRRATAVREILEAAERRIAGHGPAALSLRAVARSLGMTVQALYHYFPNRDALVTSLIAKEYEDLADAVQAALDGAPDRPDLPRLVVAAEGYRRWAVTHPERFQLLFGTPLRGYAAPAEGATTQAVRRMGTIFHRELFDGFGAEQLAAADPSALPPGLLAHLDGLPPEGPGELPPAAVALFLDAWGRLHGLVVLEVFGHTSFIGDHQAEVFRVSMLRLLEDVHRRIPARADGVAGTGTGAGAEAGPPSAGA
ncbi:putative TetR family transcriptional regulator [Actinacidiphila reveromycinica]|uniref:Putative TetR family transcriptional regulator n=1 Tax=Actinacidiphila reveromycinica TaxID=659352 RepID=A0A7U3UPJ2_9ACTN|nr:TetR/AcrR family transcriptional regulator [Streptomyces sp. SN-593]BBA96353.1 putative TetR family transcriptional regulator [Streptomyces sp. SN-593]